MEKRNNRLKSLLLHEQLKYGNYSYRYLEDKLLLILNEYKINRSITMSAFNMGIDPCLAFKWFVEGQKGNPNFKIFYQGIKRINNFESGETELEIADNDLEIADKGYEIERIANSWIYKTNVGGKDISVIASDLNHLKEKVSDKNLPI